MNFLKRVVVLDFDRTCVSSAVASLLSVVEKSAFSAGEFGREIAEMKGAFLERALRGELTPEEERVWFDRTIDIYAKSKLNMYEVHTLMRRVKVRDGLWDLLELLRDLHVPVAIISYGVKDFIEVVLQANGIRHLVDEVYAADLVVDYDTGLIKGYRHETAVFPDNKGLFSLNFAEKHGVAKEGIMAVGDSGGDAKLGYLKANRVGIAENIDDAERIREHMGEVFITDNFYPIREWLLLKFKEMRT